MVSTFMALPHGGRFIPDKLELVEGARRSLSFNLGARLGSATITSVTLVSYPSGLTFTTPAISGTSVTSNVSGGEGGRNYIAKLTSVLSNGETEVGSILLKWKEPGDLSSGGF